MGFQLPPTLPDYSKLTQVLNSSGMQKVNPPVYEILSRLIQAVQQSQDVVVNNLIQNIVNNPPITGSVSVNPAGALDGDGSGGNPLGVRVDGITIQINGSNQLIGQVSPFFLFTGSISAAFPSNINIATNPILISGGVANNIIIPIWWSLHTTKAGSWTNGGSPFQLFWTNNLGAKSNLNDLTSGYSGAGALDSFGFASGYNQAFINSGAYPIGQNLVITSNTDILSTAGASGSTIVKVAYVVLPA